MKITVPAFELLLSSLELFKLFWYIFSTFFLFGSFFLNEIFSMSAWLFVRPIVMKTIIYLGNSIEIPLDPFELLNLNF